METRGEPFEFEGEPVHSIVRRAIEPGASIDVEFLAARSVPAQGIQVGVERGAKLAWDAHALEGRSIRLWADKQPCATLRYVNPRKRTTVSIWNIWHDTHKGTRGYEPESYDIVQAWWAWSGMRIKESEEGFVLRCSGSYDGPNFDDLAVRVRFNTGPR